MCCLDLGYPARNGGAIVKDLPNDYLVMLARVRASNRGSTPSEIQANVMLFETDYPADPRHSGFTYRDELYSTKAIETMIDAPKYEFEYEREMDRDFDLNGW